MTCDKHKKPCGASRRSQSGSLTGKTVRGMAFLSMQTVLVKSSGLIGQVILSWLLFPHDFGLIGLAYTVTSLTGLIRGIGLREFLIRRKSSALWLEPAMWLGFLLGSVSSAVIVLVAPAMAGVYNEPKIAGLLYVLALSQPFASVSSVLNGVLQQQMRFKTLSALASANTIISIILSVVFAKVGMGAYSFVLPAPIVEISLLTVLWLMVKPRFVWKPKVGSWRFFAGTSTFVLLTNLCYTLVSQGDYMLLGYFHNAATVGVYYFAFNLATQATKFLWSSMGGVLFPAYTTLAQDPQRLGAAFRKTVQTIALVFVPLSLLQIPLAEPLVRLFFAEKWLPAIPLIQIMGFAMAVHSVAEPCVPLLQAQGRFAENFYLSLVWAIGFLAVVAFAARHGGAKEVAIAVAGYYLAASPVYFWVVTRKIGFGLRELFEFYLAPIILGSLAVGVGAYSMTIVKLPDIAALAALPCISLLAYVALLYVFARRQGAEAVEPLIGRLLHKFRRESFENG